MPSTKTAPSVRPRPERKTISPRIDGVTRDWLTTVFSSATVGAEWCLEWASRVLDRALYNLKGRFTEAELCALVDMHNAHTLAPRMSGSDHLALMVSDSAPDGLPEKWGYETIELVDKVLGLPDTQAAALALWACAYWTTDIYKRDGSLQEYVGRLE